MAPLVGTKVQSIVEQLDTLLSDKEAYQAMSLAHNPYGDVMVTRAREYWRNWPIRNVSTY